jgi:putative endonuclease
MNVFAYILRCADGSYYVGSTRTSLDDRIGQHNAGHFGGYTAKRRPGSLVWSQDFDRITDAIAAERQLKGWSRAKKEALIAGNYDLLHELARYRRRVSRPDPSTRACGAAQDEVVPRDRYSAAATSTPHPEPPARAGESKDKAACTTQ